MIKKMSQKKIDKEEKRIDGVRHRRARHSR